MSGKKHAKQSDVQPIWNEQQVKKVTQWLQSDAGTKQIESLPSLTNSATEAFNEMIIVDPNQLREPYTI